MVSQAAYWFGIVALGLLVVVGIELTRLALRQDREVETVQPTEPSVDE